MSVIPGPRGLPVIGNLHQVASNLHESLTKLSHDYGDVYRITLGSTPVIVLNRRKAIEQALVTQGADFAGRPEESPIFRVVGCTRGSSIIYKNYGEEWKTRYDLVERAFRVFTEGPDEGSLDQHISEEAIKMIEYVLNRQERPTFDLTVLTNYSVGNLFTRLLFSHHRELDDPVLKQMFEVKEEFLDNLGKCGVVNVFPSLDWWIPSRLRGLEDVVRRQKELLEPAIRSSFDKYVEGSVSNVHHYIKTHGPIPASSDEDTPGEDIQSVVYDLIGAGQGIVQLSLNWAFIYAIAFPELQKEIQDEIDGVVGRDRSPTLADRNNLPLTEAFLVEVSRHASVSPLTPPRLTTKDTVLSGGFGYAIPGGTMVFCNLHSLFHDPEQWENPGDFNPKRFIAEDEKSLDMDIVDSVRRFGAGPRICVGRNVATLQLFLFFAVVMHQCFLKNATTEEITLEGTAMPGSIAIRAPKVHVEMVRR